MLQLSKLVCSVPRAARHSAKTVHRMFASVSDEFAAAQANVGKLKEDPGNAVKLQLYALFKQASIGVNTDAKPSMMEFVKKAKWEAWHELRDMSQEDAMRKYVETVNGLMKGSKETPTSGFDNIDDAGSDVLRRIDGKIFNIHLNRPTKMNALTPAMYNRISDLLQESSDDTSTSITVISAAGAMYCSGNDLSNFTKGITDPPKMARDASKLLSKFVDVFIDHSKPLIALVNGPAVGIAVTTLGLCDCVYAADHATFQTPFPALGQSPEGCSSFVFPYTMGLAKANEMLLFGKKLTAREASDVGFITDVFPKDSFQQEAWAKVKQYSNLPPQSLRYSKGLVRSVLASKLKEVNAAECNRLEERWTSDECMNAIAAFFVAQQKKKAKL